jgi:hypothetical protein
MSSTHCSGCTTGPHRELDFCTETGVHELRSRDVVTDQRFKQTSQIIFKAHEFGYVCGTSLRKTLVFTENNLPGFKVSGML